MQKRQWQKRRNAATAQRSPGLIQLDCYATN